MSNHNSLQGSARKRARSPYRAHDVKRRRSRSPRREHSDRDHDSRKRAPRLPFGRQPLDKHDLTRFISLFAEYLDIQKHLSYDNLSKDELRGRWKSFLGKWNRHELAEGWYDPDMQTRVEERWRSNPEPSPHSASADLPPRTARTKVTSRVDVVDGDNDNDGYGPALPTQSRQAGPAIPRLGDLQHRDELADDDRAIQSADRRFERKAERKLQNERLDELAPRAEAGSRERQLEKKREATASNRAFRDAHEAGAEEVRDGDLLGDGDDDGFKKQLKVREKIKNERELRKEEVWRARAAEREEKLAEHRSKEEKTMDMLRDLARQRYG